jgi:hypothetical protein
MPNRSRVADAVPQRERLLLRRRDFLTLGSMGLAGLWLGGLGRAEAALLGEESRAVLPARPMSLGYLLGSEELPNVMRLPRSVLRPSKQPRSGSPAQGILNEVVRADSLPRGDTSLVGPKFQMKIHGLYPPGALSASRRPAMPLAVDLDVLFPPPDPIFPRPARFLAWSFRRRPGWDPSPPTKFVFPLDWQVMPELEMKVTPADGKPATLLSTRFTLDYEPGRPRLRRGIYLLGLEPNAFEWDISLAELARVAPLKMLSVMISFETYPVGT